MRRVVFKLRFLSLVFFAMLAGVWPMAAQAAANELGAAANFAVLAATRASCTDATINGNVGVSPGGADPLVVPVRCTINGNISTGTNQPAKQAHTDFVTAYSQFKGVHPCGTTFTTTALPNFPDINVASTTFPTGVYCFPAALTFQRNLTLTGPGPWIFEIGTDGTGALAATDFSVAGPNPCNVSWWVSQAATLTRSVFQGTILAGAAITLTGTHNTPVSSLTGRALAGGDVTTPALGAVTMTDSTIVGCNAAGIPVTGCNQGSGNDVDKDAAADRNESVKGASDRSHEDGKDKNGNGHEGCDSGNSDKDNSDKHDSDKHDSDKHDSDKHDSDKESSDKHDSDKGKNK